MRVPPRPALLWTIPLVIAATVSACDPPREQTVLEPETILLARATVELSPMEELGRELFFDHRLSLKQNQACASCHDPDVGFVGPVPGINAQGAVYKGSVRRRSGDRKPPTASYAAFSPVFDFFVEDGERVYFGGNFWDGRATGENLGNPAADQALGPFRNPVEQALPHDGCVVYRAATGAYADLYVAVLGYDPLATIAFPPDMDKLCKDEDASFPALVGVADAYGVIGLAIAAYEASSEVSPFSSKYDAWLAGEATLTADEEEGMHHFMNQGRCVACHPPPLFTDNTYDNVGLPQNPLSPAVLADPGFQDLGLGGVLGDPALYGAMKVPTLRNVAANWGKSDAIKAFGHNGVMKSLEQFVHFYNTAETLRTCAPGEVAATPEGLRSMGFDPACWPAPEVPMNVNREELGDLGLSDEQVRQIVAFLETLTDGYFMPE